MSVFPGLPGLKKEGAARTPCPIPGTPSAELSDLGALYIFLDVKRESSIECAEDPAGQLRNIYNFYLLEIYEGPGTGQAATYTWHLTLPYP